MFRLNSATTAASVEDDSPIQLAQANLPALGSVDDYMHQDSDGPSSRRSAARVSAYQPQAVPPPGIYPQGGPPQEWNYGETDPNAERSALIGAAVVGAVAVGLWAWQQHEMHQAQQRARKRYYSHQRAFDYSLSSRAPMRRPVDGSKRCKPRGVEIERQMRAGFDASRQLPRESKYFPALRTRCRSRLRIRHSRPRHRSQRGPHLLPGPDR